MERVVVLVLVFVSLGPILSARGSHPRRGQSPAAIIPTCYKSHRDTATAEPGPTRQG